jgi:hypothetical protein
MGLSVMLGARAEGVPAHDLIGGSEGFRIPGHAVSVEPGLSIALGKNYFELTVPAAVYRHASKSVADKRTKSPIGGIATFADFQVIVSYTRRF